MEATDIQYDFGNSLKRIDEILNENDKSFEERDSIPGRANLTFTNGFYVNCSALFVDICDSSKLPEYQNRPVLAKIYRSFISEMVALMNGHDTCREVCINGDCVWCVCDTTKQADMNGVFDLAGKVCSLVDILNYKLMQKGYKTYKVGVGIDFGRALMIKAGHSGSSINDVVWMGDVVNSACHLCADANNLGAGRVFLSEVIYNNLTDEYKKLCIKDYIRNIYQANIQNKKMNNWLKEQTSNDHRQTNT